METKADVIDRFWDWAEEELERRNLTWYAVERKAGLSSGAISKRVDAQRPTETTCTAIAQVFGVPPEWVFRKAGILPRAGDPRRQDLIDVLKYLQDEDLDRIMLFAEVLYRRHKRETEGLPATAGGGESSGE